jgi:hypothetical protein
MGVKGWGKIRKGRNAWKVILKEARVLHGPLSQSIQRDFDKYKHTYIKPVNISNSCYPS